MRKCLRCQGEMAEDLQLMVSGDGFGVDVREKGFFKGSLGRLKCAVCPICGYSETYLESTEKLNKALEKRKAQDEA